MKNSKNALAVAQATMKLHTICLSEREAAWRLKAFSSGTVKSLSLIPSAIFQYSLLVLLDPCSLNEFVICFPVFHPILRLKHQCIYILFDYIMQIWKFNNEGPWIGGSWKIQISEPCTSMEEWKATEFKRWRWVESVQNLPCWSYRKTSTL